jgi:hypothetical protein
VQSEISKTAHTFRLLVFFGLYNLVRGQIYFTGGQIYSNEGQFFFNWSLFEIYFSKSYDLVNLTNCNGTVALTGQNHNFNCILYS